MVGFHIAIEKPEEIIPRLGKQERHWKKGRSAYELATVWIQANGLPTAVRNVIEQTPEWRGADFLEGIFERQTSLPGRGNPSQTDLLAILALNGGNAILAVEGKVDEPFGDLVHDWLAKAKDENRSNRLAGLCMTLGLNPTSAGGLFYQLLHRTCAAIYEAKRFGYARSIMLVHSFAVSPGPSVNPACYEDFSGFSIAVGMPVTRPGSISTPKTCEGIEMRLAWVSDTPSI